MTVSEQGSETSKRSEAGSPSSLRWAAAFGSQKVAAGTALPSERPATGAPVRPAPLSREDVRVGYAWMFGCQHTRAYAFIVALALLISGWVGLAVGVGLLAGVLYFSYVYALGEAREVARRRRAPSRRDEGADE